VLDAGASVPMAELAAATFDPAVTLADMAWFREVWPGPIVVKGVHRVDDAEMIAAAGVDAIVVSNHGGRQLDRAVTPLDALGPIVERVGDRVEVYVDGGVRSGADVAAAIGLGARAVLVGRAYLYGLMAGGEAGVQRVHDLLLADLRRTMQLLGLTSVADLDGSVVRLRA
jgi:L-lactate dehydrogenase (cytochrome)